MHKREQIKDAVITAVTGLATTGTNVFKSRVYSNGDKHLPGLMVYFEEEESEPGSTGATRSLDRILNLVVEGQVKSGEDVDEIMDDIAEEVEAAMDADRYLGGLALESYLAATQFGFSGEGRRRAGSIKLVFKIFYQA